MSRWLGQDGTAKVASAVIGELVGFDINEEAEIVDDSILSEDWDANSGGSKRWSGTITCRFDSTDTTGQALMTVGATVTLNLFPEGDASGLTQLAGSARVASRAITNSRNTPVDAVYAVTGNGALVQSAVGS